MGNYDGEDAQHGAEGRQLGGHGQVGRHGRGRPFIGVRRPEMERHHGDLEPEAHQYEKHAHDVGGIA